MRASLKKKVYENFVRQDVVSDAAFFMSWIFALYKKGKLCWVKMINRSFLYLSVFNACWAAKVAIKFLKTGPYLLHTTDFSM